MIANLSIVFRFTITSSVSLIMLLACCGIQTAAFSDEASPAIIQMRPAKEIGSGLPQIDGGDKQDSDVWPATLKYYSSGTFFCTATIIGEKTVITAAHCISDGANAQVNFDIGNPVNIKCTRNKAYNRVGLVADVALCLAESSFPTHTEYENLDITQSWFTAGRPIFLLGFGCRNVHTADPATNGQLYGGLSDLLDTPISTDIHFFTQGGAVICPGDSGGAAYVLGDSNKIGGPRSIVGLNSGYLPDARISTVAAFSSANLDFINEWRSENHAKICGVDPDATNCRVRFVP
jgi:hypothetical protein